VRILVADDSVLFREGLARLLGDAGMTCCCMAGDADQLHTAVDAHPHDVAIIDICMPPDFVHEGAKAATSLRRRQPTLPILLLSQSLEGRYAAALAAEHPHSFGYLLKDRVVDVGVLVDAVRRVHAGGTVLDPDVVRYLLGRQPTRQRVSSLSDRERDVLGLMAQGRTNSAIARTLQLSEKAVENRVAGIFVKLDLLAEPDDNRRVLAVVTWLQEQR
jgi:DNA-binding NarL/FixJ family response regulator